MAMVRASPARSAVVVPTLVLLVLSLATNPRFANPDDGFFQLSLDGTLWGDPTGDVVVIRPLLTDALEQLYRWADVVPWYPGLHLAMQLAAWTMLLYTFLVHRASATWFGWAIATAVAVGLGLRLWMTMQYTSTAGLLISAGIALHASSDRPDGWSTRAVLAGLAVGIGGLLRWEMLPVLLLVASPWLILARPVGERRRAHALFLGVVVTVTALGVLHEQAKYRGDEAWSQYRSYNAIRGALNDSPGLTEFDRLSPAMAERGWTDNDVELLAQFSLVDPVVFSEDNLEALHDDIGGARRSISAAIEDVDVSHPLFFAVGALVGVIALITTDRRGRLILIASGAIAFALVAYAAFFLHLPFYVSASLVFLLAAMAVLQPPPARRSIALGALGLLTVATIASAVELAIDSGRNGERSDRTVAFFDELDELDPEGTYLLESPNPIEHLSPLETTALPDVELFIGTWFAGSPQYERRLAALGEGSAIDIVLAEPNVYLVTDTSRIGRYQTFVDQHVGGNVTLVPALRHDFDGSTELVALTRATE